MEVEIFDERRVGVGAGEVVGVELRHIGLTRSCY